MRRRRFFELLVAAFVTALSSTAGSTVLVSVEEALALAFPGAVHTRETVFLSAGQVGDAAALSGTEIPSSLVTRYVATARDGTVQGFGYLDTHRVRTLPETVLIAVGPDGTVLRVEVVVFREPLEYKPREGWYGQYEGEQLDRDLALERDIRPVTGATLTARATTEAVRRVLAIHRALESGGAE